MSWSGTIPLEADQSDSRILIEACLARVREHAGLDDEPVLPPLHVLAGKPEAAPPTRLVIGPPAGQLPSAEAIVRSVVSKAPRTGVATTKTSRAATTIVHRLRWPVVLCGFIGAFFGGMAFMRSPVGQRPAVQHVMTKARGHVAAVYGATVAAASRL